MIIIKEISPLFSSQVFWVAIQSYSLIFRIWKHNRSVYFCRISCTDLNFGELILLILSDFAVFADFSKNLFLGNLFFAEFIFSESVRKKPNFFELTIFLAFWKIRKKFFHRIYFLRIWRNKKVRGDLFSPKTKNGKNEFPQK